MSDPEHRFMTAERVMIREVAAEFTLKEVLPLANELDPIRGEIPMSLRDKLAEMGYFGIRLPQEYGGSGLGWGGASGFAVEFDIAQNDGDRNDNHVGVNVGGRVRCLPTICKVFVSTRGRDG